MTTMPLMTNILCHRVGEVPACDIIVGPGNNWVTAAKSLVSGR